MSDYGIILVSHSKNIAQGIYELIQEVAKDVEMTYVGGNPDGGIGTSFDQVQDIIQANPKEKLLAFYDLGSAKMNLDMAMEFSDKEITLYNVAVVEGTYTAAALLQAGASIDMIEAQLKDMELNK